MYARKDMPSVLPDAVLRCRKLQAAANVELDEMERAKYRRINNLEWQQQSFQKNLTERHKRWRMYDRAFRLKLKRELGADLAAALRIRTIQDEEEKYLFEQQLIEQSLEKQKKNDRGEQQTELNPSTAIEAVSKATSAHPKSNQEKIPVSKKSQSAVEMRRTQSAATRASHSASIINNTPKVSPRRPRTSRFDTETRRDTDPSLGLRNDFGSVLFRILSNIAATPDLDDDFTIRKRALEARERRLIQTKDDRYFNLVKELSPRKIHGVKDIDDEPGEENE